MTELPDFIPDAIARRNYIRTNLARSVWESFSGAEILQSLRDMGLGINTGDFYRIRGEVLGMIQQPDVFDAIKDDPLIPRVLFRDDHGFDLTEAALYRFTIYGKDLETGEDIEITRAVTSDRQLSVEQATTQISQFYPVGLKYENMEITSVELMDALIMPGAMLL